MLAFEALSFGLKIPDEGAMLETQAMEFGVCVGEGAAVVCRWAFFGNIVPLMTSMHCYEKNTVFEEYGHCDASGAACSKATASL